MIHQMRTNLKGFKANCFGYEDLTGFFDYNGRPMTDVEIRTVVEWGIQHGYETDADLPSDMVKRIIDYVNAPMEEVNQLSLF